MPDNVNENVAFVFRRDTWYASCQWMRRVITQVVSALLLVMHAPLLGTFHAAAAAATPTVLSPTAGMTTFPIHGTVAQPTVFSPNALQPFAGSHFGVAFYDLFNSDQIVCFAVYCCRAMLCKRGLCRHAVSVCLCLSRSWILSKRINIASNFFHHWVATPF